VDLLGWLFLEAFAETSSSFFAVVSLLPGGFSSVGPARSRILVPFDCGTDPAAETKYEALKKYSRDLTELDRYCSVRDPSWVDRDGKLRWAGGEIVINFGKKRGEKLRELARTDASFLRWILKGDFATDTKEIVAKILEGKRIDPIGGALGDQLVVLKEAVDPEAG